MLGGGHPGITGLANAISYTPKRWSVLVRMVDNGTWPIDNNPIERAILPIAIARKNWMSVGAETAGQCTLTLISLADAD